MSTPKLPKGWRLVVLGDVADLALGKMLDKAKQASSSGHRFPYLRNVNVRWGTIELHDLFTMPFEEDELERYGLRAGDLLVCEGGEPGRCALWDGSVPDIKFQKALHRVRPGPELDARFLQHRIEKDAKTGALDDYFTGTTIKHLPRTALARYQLSLPSLDEQRRIVAKLDALRARSRKAKEALDAVPALLDRLRQSILASAFRGDLTADWRAQNPDVEPASELLKRIRIERRARWEEAQLAKMLAKGKPPTNDRWKAKYVEPEPVDETDLPELPEDWCWASLSEIVAGDAPLCYGVVQPGDDVDDGVPLVRVQDLFTKSLAPHRLRRISMGVDSEYARSRIQENDVLVSIVGTIGRTALVPKVLAGSNIARAVARVRPSSLLSPSFVHWALASPLSQHRFNLDAREVARKTLNIDVLSAVPIALPSLAEQSALTELLGRALPTPEALVDSVTHLSQLLREVDAAILAKAFRGELVDRQSEAPPPVLSAAP